MLHKLLRAVEADSDRKPPPSFFRSSLGVLSGGPNCRQKKDCLSLSPAGTLSQKIPLTSKRTHTLPPAQKQDLTLSSLHNYCWLQYLMLLLIPPPSLPFFCCPLNPPFSSTSYLSRSANLSLSRSVPLYLCRALPFLLIQCPVILARECVICII